MNNAKHDSYSDDSFDIFSENQRSNNELDLEGLQILRNQYRSNPLIGYLNINFQNRFIKTNIKETIIRNNLRR